MCGCPAPPPAEQKWLIVAYGDTPPAGLVAELVAQPQAKLAKELAAAERAAGREPLLPHFLYFPTAAAAQAAARRLRAEGYKKVAVKAPDSEYFEDEAPPGTHPLDREWQVVASGDVPPPGEPFGDPREHLEALAKSLGGYYDG